MRVLQWGRPGFDPCVRKIPWRRKWQPTPVLLPREFHGQRSLVGCSPWGRKESDTTEWLTFLYESRVRYLLNQGSTEPHLFFIGVLVSETTNKAATRKSGRSSFYSFSPYSLTPYCFSHYFSPYTLVTILFPILPRATTSMHRWLSSVT